VRGSLLRHWAPGILRTQAFRIVLIYVFVFAVSATVLVGFTYWHTERSLDAQTDQIIEAEVTGLVEQYQRLGVMGLAQAVAGRSTHEGQDLYLLADSQGRFLAGNLDKWPPSVTRANEFLEFEYAAACKARWRQGAPAVWLYCWWAASSCWSPATSRSAI